ncbi:JAB domain-containing protein [Luteibacter sp. UNC138MFCol5.1]|uniref:Mov34/MPN/PAD-1 family protein n=1 Tax=Luteibacter sp. UNC138MFCol5.1 TaxID=1502774 RepID=UPI0008C369C9|nr:Mov34/MPN/PAD-1 family protein [Luteibacter sp. UNC138MFCol5.1]SEO46217.1 JAB domain-containing protein [Luteibacter sp. UNC138MFCol5.1]
MIGVTFTADALNKLRSALQRTRSHEVGGVLVGQHLSADLFAVLDLSVQVTEGTRDHFVRDPSQHRAFLDAFFERTGHDYARFNYLGEWHSHIHVAAIASGPDIATMQAIVADPAVNAAMAVLVVARLGGGDRLEMSATVYRDGSDPAPVALSVIPLHGAAVAPPTPITPTV